MRLGGIRGVERRRLEDLFGNICDWRAVEYVALIQFH